MFPDKSLQNFFDELRHWRSYATYEVFCWDLVWNNWGLQLDTLVSWNDSLSHSCQICSSKDVLYVLVVLRRIMSSSQNLSRKVWLQSTALPFCFLLLLISQFISTLVCFLSPWSCVTLLNSLPQVLKCWNLFLVPGIFSPASNKFSSWRHFSEVTPIIFRLDDQRNLFLVVVNILVRPSG